MKLWLLVFGLAYLLFLAWYSYRSWRRSQERRDPQLFLFERGNVGAFLGFMGISATLFSTFTLQGMPAFFRSHGIAAWVFLGVTDVCLAALLMAGGLALRRVAMRSHQGGVKNLTELLRTRDAPSWVLWMYVIVATLFLIPYVTIQIKGASLLFYAAYPLGHTHLTWSIIIVAVMLLYSCLGGIRAIFVTDAVQGTILLVVAWLLAGLILRNTDGLGSLFADVAAQNPKLLSAPGPAGLLGVQFLLIGFVSICSMPYVQPQLATRVLVLRSDRAFVRTCIGLCVFALLVITPTLVIGFRGVGVTSDAPGGFLAAVLISDGGPILHALFIVGVLAAAMSTADSQVLAVGTEWGSILRKTPIGCDPRSVLLVKVVAILVSVIALVFAQTEFQSLVLFSVNSFIGTSFMLPAVIGACACSRVGRIVLGLVSLVCIVTFMLIVFRFIPRQALGIRLELWLYLFSALSVALTVWSTRRCDLVTPALEGA